MERIIVEYLANALWQIPLLVAGVAALLWALGSDVQTRHRVWLAVLAVAVLMPLRGMEVGHKITVLAPPPADLKLHSAASAAIMPEPLAAPAEEEPPQAGTAVDDPVVVYDPIPAAKSGLTIGPAATRWLVRFYAAALLFAGWRILRSWVAAHGLIRRSRSIHLAPRAMAIFAQAAERQQIRLPRLRQSDETVSPVVIGAWRPVLLLPAGFDHLKDDEILAALSHEFAHLARRDYLVNLLCQAFALPISWHPATYVVQKRIRDTREMLCDAVAADEMASPVRYATCLVAFALRALDNHQGALATQGLSMFDNRILEERILQLTQEPARPAPRTRLARLAGASCGLVLSVILALTFHVTPTLADTVDPVPPTAPVPLTPRADLPAIPPAAPVPPEAPAAPTPPAAPVSPVAPTSPRVTVHHHDHVKGSDEIQRGIAEEQRQQAEQQREAAQVQRDEAQRQREVAQAERDAAQGQRDAAQVQREEAQRQREIAQAQREQAREQAHHQRDMEREKAQQAREAAQAQRDAEEEKQDALREAAEEQREAAREAAQAAREAAEEARQQADEIRRQVSEAVKANEAARNIDMDSIRKQVAAANASVNTPEFKAQMAELQTHMKELHEHMAELRDHMKQINKEMEKSLKAPM